MSLPPAVILAGGKATRMGGGDKCLIEVGGARIIDHILTRLRPQAGAIALNANGDASRFSEFGLPVLPDSLPDHPGPLAGILAGLDWAAEQGASHLLSIAGDTPFFPTDLTEKLTGALKTGPVLAASQAPGDKLRRHPVFGLWPTALRDDLRQNLTEGLRKIVLWTDAHNATTAEFLAKPYDSFLNINTPEDIALAQAALEAAG